MDPSSKRGASDHASSQNSRSRAVLPKGSIPTGGTVLVSHSGRVGAIAKGAVGPLLRLRRGRQMNAGVARTKGGNMATVPQAYPVQFSIDYPDRPLNRLTTAFRIIVIIPIFIVLSSVSGSTWMSSYGRHGATYTASGAGGLLFFGPLLMILFRRKYPRWWFDWNLELQRFSNRVSVYLALMDDRYPSTYEHQSVHLEYVYPDAARDLNRWLPLVKFWLLAIP